MLSLTIILAMFMMLTGFSIFFRVCNMINTPFKAELRGDPLIVDLLEKRVLIGKRKKVYVPGTERGIWLANAKQCLQDTE